MKYFTLISLIFLLLTSSFAQKIKVKTLANLPPILWESSGLVAGTKHSVWTHNDSGGEAVLYKIDSTAHIIRTVKIIGLRNTDWEDLANDYLGYIYIADIGNNCNCRKNLKILKIPHPDSLTLDSVIPEVINFSYENQNSFPPNKANLNFDAEALIAYQDSLFIFTKNRTKPYSQKTYIYALVNKAGPQKAVLYDSLLLKHTHKYRSWLTSATRHPFQDKIILLSHKKAWFVEGFRSKKINLTKTKISGIYSQKEAIAYDLEGDIWITNEKFKFLRAKISIQKAKSSSSSNTSNITK